ncbi:MAG: hypothetical protein JXQ90_22505 [Cyclobacteriaceae bacterium]
MKRFIQKSLLFMLIILSINTYFFQIVYENYYSEYEHVELDFKTYLLSDSHGKPLDKINEPLKFYNFSAGSDSYVDMKRKLQFLAEKSNIERLIITADNHTLSPYRDKSNNVDRSSFFTKFSFENKPYKHLKENYIERYLPIINPKSRDIVKLFLLAEEEPIKSEPNWKALKPKEKSAFAKRRTARQFRKLYPSKIQTSALHEIIDICKQNDIELVGIKYPLSREYLAAMGNSTFQADSILMSKKSKIYDFSNIYINQDHLFRNQDHLNEDGGRLFTDLILNLE